MKTILEIEEILRRKDLEETHFLGLDQDKKNYYIGWKEGLNFTKNALLENESSAQTHVEFMINCLSKSIDSRKAVYVNNLSQGWLKGYLESLKWFLN